MTSASAFHFCITGVDRAHRHLSVPDWHLRRTGYVGDSAAPLPPEASGRFGQHAAAHYAGVRPEAIILVC